MKTIGAGVQLFDLGMVVATSNLMSTIKNPEIEIKTALVRHSRGDWGITKDKTANDISVENSINGQEATRIHSIYKTQDGNTIWVITELDRSATTVMLPEDY